MTRAFEIVEMKVGKGVDLGFEIKDFPISNMVL